MNTALELLPTSEACKVLGSEDRPLHPSTISRWVREGRLTPAVKLPGDRGAFLFAPAEVERVRAELAARGAS